MQASLRLLCSRIKQVTRYKDRTRTDLGHYTREKGRQGMAALLS